jgi:ABC-2 type transport system permease protein
MNYLFGLWLKLTKTRLKTFVIYKTDFIIGFFAMIASNITGLLFFWVLFQHIPTLNGWIFEEVILITSMATISFGIWGMFFAGPTFWHVEHLIRSGDFDNYMTRPVKPLTFLLLESFDTDEIGTLLTGIAMFLYATSALGVTWSITTILMALIFFISGAVIITSTFIIFSTPSFWIVRGGAIGEIMFKLMDFIKYPLNIFNPIVMMFLTFALPLAFVSYYPAQVILQKGTTLYLGYLTPVVAIITFLIANKVWDFAMKKYTSTGS